MFSKNIFPTNKKHVLLFNKCEFNGVLNCFRRMPWQGQHENLIDRFDVRAHLDYIPPISKHTEQEEIAPEERHCNYESYRILAQNDFLGSFFVTI